MNRMPLPTKHSSQLSSQHSKYEWSSRHESQLPFDLTETLAAHSLLAPMHYESGYAYPLIVWLHGSGGNEEEVWQVMPLISLRNHVAVAPRGTIHCDDICNAFDWGTSPDAIVEAGERIQQCVKIAGQRYNVHPDRVFLAGYGSGGTLAYRLGMEYPEQFAGAISLGGPVPRSGQPLRRIKQARQLPLLLAVSPDASQYSTSQVMDDLRLLHHAGFSLSLRLYPDGDGLTTTMLSDVNDWVMEQWCPSATVSAS